METSQHILSRKMTSEFIITPSKNPLYGSLEISEECLVSTSSLYSSFTNTKIKKAFHNGTIENLKKQASIWKAEGIPGTIQVIEVLESDLPESQKEHAKPKVAGETGIPCTLQGEIIYRFSKWTPNSEAKDSLLAHDNGEYIRTEQARLKALDKESVTKAAPETTEAANF